MFSLKITSLGITFTSFYSKIFNKNIYFIKYKSLYNNKL
ncbi:hypothetical protein BVAVS116_H0119 (plasmid) [Borreliella valaisiana VS116]|uniref:Uncharacterized protein n=1 Tax=Borreliella valaisiana VS116 TaxID=445987 RepID=C0R934_BORVA|nr:hypothetical protein BVAVS116_H0119 [Borreliella valaisiana VS116]